MKKLVALASFLVLSGSLGVAALFASSAPSFAVARNYPAGREPASVATGDLNGDGKPDLATANNAAGTASVLLNKGDGSFRGSREYRTAFAPYSVAIGDLNGDGKPDLAIANGHPTNSVSVLVNRGNGRFLPNVDYRTGRGSSSVAIGDLNGDGKSDLATANGRANTVSVLINAPGLCTVQNVEGKRLSVAKRVIARANCRVGKTRRANSKAVERGRVISQKPRPGTVLPSGGKVELVASKGPRR